MLPATRIVVLGALAIASAAAGVGAGMWYTQSAHGGLTSATVLDAPRALPDFSLVDEHGAAFTRADLAGRWTYLFFGYTHCPDVCPLTLQVLARALQSFGDEAPGERPTARFVSVDPERDTPEQLARYLSAFGGDLHALTGTPEAIAALTAALGIAYARVDDDGGGYAMDHTAAVLLLDPQGRLVAVFTPPQDARSLAADLRTIRKRSPS
jgi:protein SCO1